MEPQSLSFFPQQSLPEAVIEGQDDLLVQKASAGDQAAFAILVARYREKLYRIIRMIVHHEEDSWDLLQDTFLKSYQALPELKKDKAFGKWLVKIAVNLSINHLRHQKRNRQHQENIGRFLAGVIQKSSPQQKLEQIEINEKLQQLIGQLPPKQKTVLALADIEGYSYREIAQVLQCRIGTVMSRLYHARNFIRQRFADISGSGHYGGKYR